MNTITQYIFTIYCICFMLTSCDGSDRENYRTNNEIYEECLSDSSEYFVVSFYSDNTLRLKGSITNLKKDKIWTEWYTDGKISKYDNYYNGYLSLDFITNNPLVILLDSLVVGKASRVRLVGSKESQVNIGGSDLDIVYPDDKSEYDLLITPFSKNIITFWGAEIDSLETAKAMSYRQEYAKKRGLTEDEAKDFEIKIKRSVILREAIVQEK